MYAKTSDFVLGESNFVVKKIETLANGDDSFIEVSEQVVELYTIEDFMGMKVKQTEDPIQLIAVRGGRMLDGMKWYAGRESLILPYKPGAFEKTINYLKSILGGCEND